MVELDSVENDQDAVAEAQEGFEGDRLAAQADRMRRNRGTKLTGRRSRMLRIWGEEGISCMPNGVWQFGRARRESSPLVVPRGMRIAV